jgi:hypothetical protein
LQQGASVGVECEVRAVQGEFDGATVGFGKAVRENHQQQDSHPSIKQPEFHKREKVRKYSGDGNLSLPDWPF